MADDFPLFTIRVKNIATVGSVARTLVRQWLRHQALKRFQYDW